MDRKDFFKSACIAGGCLCGFGTLIKAENVAAIADAGNKPKPDTMHKAWIASLLTGIDEKLDESTKRLLMKRNAKAHYDNLNMDKTLENYVGKIDTFMKFLEKEWGWKIDYRPSERTILADENKSWCVCPLLDKEKGISSTLCYCSEGFAELMFGKVMQCKVSSDIVSSVLKGDKTCVYKIKW